MKNFLSIFAICLIVCTLFLSFGGYLIFEHFWLLIGLVSLFFAILISAYVGQQIKIEELEGRIEALESKRDQ